MRNISFMLTPEQILAGTKTVTRRCGWEFVKVGDHLQGVRKCQGLKAGEKIERLRVIRVTDVRREELGLMMWDVDYGCEEVISEGFPDMALSGFVNFFCESHKGCTPQTVVTRIEFCYPDEAEMLAAGWREKQ